jgi:hypothetical protein
MLTHKCPRCNNDTEGSYSEGGLLWAICDDCMQQEREEIEYERMVAKRQFEYGERWCVEDRVK